ncbi:MAG: hypothetical protein AMDU2_EPLC00004G0001 [Thermoplasmatales archaeon E-plasma]|jgi:hypothetical protein|nr:MAG: hypothetical protein AMDU2_EPLC00004G0001 [Thermoplasmatales archaeon E-plasma]
MTEIRRVYKSEMKMKIVFKRMNATIHVSDLYRKYDIKSSRFYNWIEKLVKSSLIFHNHNSVNLKVVVLFTDVVLAMLVR